MKSPEHPLIPFFVRIYSQPRKNTHLKFRRNNQKISYVKNIHVRELCMNSGTHYLHTDGAEKIGSDTFTETMVITLSRLVLVHCKIVDLPH